jgi:predicted nucleic acid-binding protein
LILILADTGILLRLLERTDPQHGAVRDALRLLRQRGHRGVTAPQNASEFWNVCTRPATARGGFGLSVPEADRRLRIVERLFQVLPDSPAVYAAWRRMIVTHAVMGVQVHDARLAAFLEIHGLTHLLTLNPGDFARYPGVTAITPASVITSSP